MGFDCAFAKCAVCYGLGWMGLDRLGGVRSSCGFWFWREVRKELFLASQSSDAHTKS